MWDWLQGLSGGAATFLGALTGSSVGLVAILVGALFNAHLNRRRDDRVRREDVRSVATALQAELMGLHRTLIDNAKGLKEAPADFLVPDLKRSVVVFPELLSKLGFLDVETIRSVIDAHIVVRQYADTLTLLGGQRGSTERGQENIIAMSNERVEHVIAVNESTAEQIDKAIQLLKRHV
jgi:hypothetical protein